MKAEKMFNELGFTKRDGDLFYSHQNGDTVACVHFILGMIDCYFYLISEYEKYGNDTKLYHLLISPELLKAINKQVKELGWSNRWTLKRH